MPKELSPELQEEWRDYERLFGDPGWARLMRKTNDRIKSIKERALYTVKDEKSLWQHRGWIAILEEFAGLEAQIRAQHDALLAEESDERLDELLNPHER